MWSAWEGEMWLIIIIIIIFFYSNEFLLNLWSTLEAHEVRIIVGDV